MALGEASAVLLGIDDTDNESSPGTGYLAQQLLRTLEADELATPLGATRHQLLKDPRVPFTTHNSSACLRVLPRDGVTAADLHARAARFLRDFSAEGSDPGLAVVAAGEVPAEAVDFGRTAKVELVDQPACYAAAEGSGVLLSGLGGTEDGVIGALAAVGLHDSGSDGFYLWLPGLRDFRAGSYTIEEIRQLLPITDARTEAGRRPDAGQEITMDPWVRPLLLDGGPMLLLEDTPIWRSAPRKVVRQH